MKYITLSILLFVLATACDPLRRIQMKNKSGSDVEITWTLKESDTLQKTAFFMSNSDKVKFDLKPSRPYNEVNMSFGIGSWTADTLRSVTNSLESLQIKSAGGTIHLKSPEDIYNFLSNRKKGITKRKIVIDVRR